jgi:peptide deformylase
MGDARLLQRAEPVTQFDTPQLHALLQDMHDTMQALNGAGLAAPQIGVGLRVVIFGVRLRHVTAQQPLAGAAARHFTTQHEDERTVAEGPKNSRYPDADNVPETVLINPVITPLNERIEEGWEGCLSVPGMRGVVPRYAHLRYQGCDEYGALIDRTVSGFHARVVQHECDHLDGILYPMRIKDMSKFGYTAALFPEGNVQDERGFKYEVQRLT